MKTILITIITLALLFGASPALADNLNQAGTNLQGVAQKAGTTEGDIGALVGTFIYAALSIVGILFLVLMVYAGILWMTARGADEQVEKARKIIYASVIGLFITVSAYAITVFVTGRFG